MTNLNSKKIGQIFKIPLLSLVFATIFVYVVLAAVSTPISSVVLNTTSGGNYTYENLTAYPSPFNSSQIYIYDWRVNGSSIASLNLPFEGESADDYSTNAHIVTLNGGVTYNATGDMNGGGSYRVGDAEGDTIDIPHHDDFIGHSMTVSMWAKIPTGYIIPSDGGDGNDGGYLMTKSNATADKYDWGLELDGNTDLYLTPWNNMSALVKKGLEPFNDSEWHHYAFTSDEANSIMRLYFDGAMVNESTLDFTIEAAHEKRPI